MRDALRGESLVLCLALMNSRTPDVPAIAAASGYDAVYVDLEHTSTSLETAAMLCASATGAGIWALVRVSSQEPSLIARVLDIPQDLVRVTTVWPLLSQFCEELEFHISKFMGCLPLYY